MVLTKDQLNEPLVIGIVGHCEIEILPEIKKFLQNLDGFRLVFFRTSTDKLYIKEEDADDR